MRSKLYQDSLDIYLDEIKNIPLLSRQEEIELAKKVRQGDKKAIEELTLGNLRFVVKIAREYQGRGVVLADLINEGNLGLFRAAQKFDDRKGVKFISYAVWWIRQAVLKTILMNSRTVRLPQNRVEEITKMTKAKNKISQIFGREPTVAEIAQELGIKEEEVKNAIKIAQSDISMSSSKNLKNSMYFTKKSKNLLYPSPEEAYERHALKESLLKKLNKLSSREKEILELYFGIDGERPHTLEEIGKMNNITRERVRQIKERALKKLREMGVRENEKDSDISNSKPQ
ncbi:RNA polymerase sigma factor RpoD/SigA [candidate division WOR-3 bacterium]|nr:RNA polymerase sigma factor RpoD/SigA [candidate division WOR-3 bacterium]